MDPSPFLPNVTTPSSIDGHELTEVFLAISRILPDRELPERRRRNGLPSPIGAEKRTKRSQRNVDVALELNKTEQTVQKLEIRRPSSGTAVFFGWEHFRRQVVHHLRQFEPAMHRGFQTTDVLRVKPHPYERNHGWPKFAYGFCGRPLSPFPAPLESHHCIKAATTSIDIGRIDVIPRSVK